MSGKRGNGGQLIMCDLSNYTVFDIEYHKNTKGNCCDLRVIFREEFVVLKISILEKFTNFLTNIHPCFW